MKFTIILLLTLFFSCNNNKMFEKEEFKYNVNIDYLNTPLNKNEKLTSDSLIIMFEGDFHEDTVEVQINNSYFTEMILSTNDVTGEAGNLYTKKFDDIYNISMRINEGSLIFIEPCSIKYNIMLDYSNKCVKVKFYRLFPAMD